MRSPNSAKKNLEKASVFEAVQGCFVFFQSLILKSISRIQGLVRVCPTAFCTLVTGITLSALTFTEKVVDLKAECFSATLPQVNFWTFGQERSQCPSVQPISLQANVLNDLSSVTPTQVTQPAI